MAFVAKDKDGSEWIFAYPPYKVTSVGIWQSNSAIDDSYIELPTGSIARLIGRDLKWEDEPVELT